MEKVGSDCYKNQYDEYVAIGSEFIRMGFNNSDIFKDEAYPGNMGVMELVEFYKKANPDDVSLMDKIIAKASWGEFKQLIKKVLGVSLKDSK
jgi:hypothetical protein